MEMTIAEITAWVSLIIILSGLIYKVSKSHFQLFTLIKNDEENKNRLNNLDTFKIKVEEALDRTFVSKEYVFASFVTKEEHTASMSRLEEKLVNEMQHMNKTLERISKTLEEKK